MKATLTSCAHPEYGEVTIPFPIPEEDYDRTMELLEERIGYRFNDRTLLKQAITQITASITSDIIESLFLPPVNSSPRPSRIN